MGEHAAGFGSGQRLGRQRAGGWIRLCRGSFHLSESRLVAGERWTFPQGAIDQWFGVTASTE